MADTLAGFSIASPNHTVQARMQDSTGRLGKLVRGTENIRTLIGQGWVIVADPVNRLLPEHLSHCLTDLNVTDEQAQAPQPIHQGYKGKRHKNKYRR